MIALLQRVTQAHVQVDGKDTGRIGAGLLVLLGVERGDTEAQADRLLERLLTYRIFADDADKMNLSLQDQRGGLLLVSAVQPLRKSASSCFTILLNGHVSSILKLPREYLVPTCRCGYVTTAPLPSGYR